MERIRKTCLPVKIDPDSSPITIGDFLTSSNKSGLARKATRPGYVVARTLEVDSLKTKTLEVGGVNVLNEINELKRRMDAMEKK